MQQYSYLHFGIQSELHDCMWPIYTKLTKAQDSVSFSDSCSLNTIGGRAVIIMPKNAILYGVPFVSKLYFLNVQFFTVINK